MLLQRQGLASAQTLSRQLALTASEAFKFGPPLCHRITSRSARCGAGAYLGTPKRYLHSPRLTPSTLSILSSAPSQAQAHPLSPLEAVAQELSHAPKPPLPFQKMGFSNLNSARQTLAAIVAPSIDLATLTACRAECGCEYSAQRSCPGCSTARASPSGTPAPCAQHGSAWRPGDGLSLPSNYRPSPEQ